LFIKFLLYSPATNIYLYLLHFLLDKRKQCMGLRDENGNLIYEGDVLGLPNQQNGGKVVIRWENAGAEFWAVDRDNYGGNAESFLSWAAIAGREQVIILGNIYENPELLGGANETYGIGNLRRECELKWKD
jgi:uncharacterized phage protein (TIGR01671 family)